MTNEERDLAPLDSVEHWCATLEARVALKPGKGVVLCVELWDRSTDQSALTDVCTEAIWRTLARTFGGPLRLALDGRTRGFLAAPDESRWLAIAAAAVEAAVQAGMEGRDLGVGVGVTRMEDRDQTIAELARLAALGASEAAKRGVGLIVESPAREAREARKAQLWTSLCGALDGEIDALRVLLQPKVDARTKEVVGAEALLRFRCPQLGDVSALELLSVAETFGELERVDRWVLSLTAERQGDLVRRGISPLPISVNVRGTTAFDRTFPEFMIGLVTNFGIDPNTIEVELRERDLVESMTLAERAVAGLRRLGLPVALDDFGARRNALVDLRRLAVTSLRLDRGIVREVATDARLAQTAAGMMRLANALGLGTVAVGIESPEQAEQLAEAGCRTLQGFLFHRVLEVEEFEALVYGHPERAAA